jgi:hypothetical protein
VDEEVREGFQPARWLAWATAGLLVAGVVSVGAVSGGERNDARQIVSAAGTGADGVETPPPPPPLELVPPPPPPPTTAAPLVAPSSVVAPPPTVPVTAPPTSQAVRATTTTTRPAAAPSATVTTAAPATRGKATVVVVNQHPEPVVATVNGHVVQVASGQQSAPVEMTLASHGNDTVSVALASDPTCGMGDAGPYFPAGGRYRLTVTAGQGMCRNAPGPQVEVASA